MPRGAVIGTAKHPSSRPGALALALQPHVYENGVPMVRLPEGAGAEGTMIPIKAE